MITKIITFPFWLIRAIFKALGLFARIFYYRHCHEWTADEILDREG